MGEFEISRTRERMRSRHVSTAAAIKQSAQRLVRAAKLWLETANLKRYQLGLLGGNITYGIPCFKHSWQPDLPDHRLSASARAQFANRLAVSLATGGGFIHSYAGALGRHAKRIGVTALKLLLRWHARWLDFTIWYRITQ